MNPWKALKRSLHPHSPFLTIEDVLFELPDGREATYSLTHVGKAVCLLALTRNQEVILARQFRPGPNRMLDELPGGYVDQGEAPEQTANRELLEETGYAAGSLIALGRFLEGAYSTIDIHGFLALNCELRTDQKLDANEFIEVVLKPLPEFLKQLRKGQLTDGETAWAGLAEAGIIKLPH